MRKFFCAVFFILYSINVFAQDQRIQIDVQGNTTLEDFISFLEAEYGFLFSYKEDDVKGLRLKVMKEQGSIDSILTKVLQPTLLEHKIIKGNYIILTKKEITKQENWLTYCGQVRDSLLQIPLSFANVFFLKSKKGTTTNADGFFEIKVPSLAEDSLVISYVGYAEKRFLATAFSEKPCKTITLSNIDFGEDFVVVTEYLTEGIELHNNTFSTQLRPNKTGILPGQAEPDILESLQFLPGISSTDGTASALSIRGGTADQNLILWEDIPIYHAAHYFGTISAFNPYIIDKVSVYRGGFDAVYGGRVSGVVDIKSEGLDQTKSDVGLGLNLLNAYTNGSISLVNNKLKVIYSARRSIADWWRSPAYESLTKRIQQGVLVQDVDLDNLPKGIEINDDFTFFDANVKLAYQLSDKDELSVAAFYGYNDFESEVFDAKLRQRQTDTLYLDNRGLSIAWQHQWNSRFSTRLLAVHSDYKYDYEYRLQTEYQNQNPGAPQLKLNRYGLKDSKISEQQLHLTGNYKTKRARELVLGYQLMKYHTDFSLTKITEEDLPIIEAQQKESRLHVLFGNFKTSEAERLGVDLGLRLNYFELDESFFYEPRLRLWYKLSNHFYLHVNGGRYHQFLSQLYEVAGDDSSISTPVWTLAGGANAPVLDALQLQTGFVYQKESWLLEVQLYHKRINGQSSLSSGFNEDLGNRFHIGTSKVRGVDVLLKKRWAGFRSWMSYTLSKNDYSFPSFFDKSFPGPSDQRHVFNWVNSYTCDRWAFSLGWKIGTGRPYSLLSNFEIETTPSGPNGSREFVRPVIKEFNSVRLRASHQLDAAVRYQFSSKVDEKWRAILGLSFTNLYNQKNIYDRSFTIRRKPGESPVLVHSDRIGLGLLMNSFVRVAF